MTDLEHLERVALAATPELLPCPFCGGHASVVLNSFPPPTKRHRWYHPSCDDGECPGYVAEQDEQGGTCCDFKTEAEAIAAWNRRAPNLSLIAEIRELREALTQALPHLEENARWHRDAQSHAAKVTSAFAAVERARKAAHSNGDVK